MGVYTTLWRVSPDLLEKLRSNPELVDRLCYDEEVDGVTPPSVDADKDWEDLLRVLSYTDSKVAHDVLDVELEDVEGRDVAFYTADMVSSGAIVLQDLRLDEIRESALQSEDLRTYGRDGAHIGDPLGYEYLIDALLGLLGKVVDFWREAAAAGEAILSETS